MTKIEGIPIERFNGANIDELYTRQLPDRIDHNLDLVIVNICPTLLSVHMKSHHSGPGNHLWQCLHESGITDRLYRSTEDTILLGLKIGMVNMIQTAIRKSPTELTQTEIKDAQETLTQRIRQYNPKVVAFNGKLAFEIYIGKNPNYEFNYGKQSITFDSNTTNTLMYVLPSSEARGSSYRLLPRYTDKMPFFLGLKNLCDTLNGNLSGLSDSDFIFPEFKVALERNKDYVGSDGEEEENNLNESKTTGGPRGKRYQKLNNLPFSQIPSSVLDAYNSSVSKGKKDVIIPTSESIYYTENNTSSEQTSDFMSTISSVVSSVLCDQGSIGTPSVSSGFDEQMNSDSDSSTTGMDVTSVPINQIGLSPSVINVQAIKPLNSRPVVINLSSGDRTIKQILSSPLNSLRNITAQTVNLKLGTTAQYSQNAKLNMSASPQAYKIVGKPNEAKIITGSPSVIKIQNVQNLNEAQTASPQIVRKDMNTIILLNQTNTNKNIKIVPKPQTQPQQPPIKILSAEPSQKVILPAESVKVVSYNIQENVVKTEQKRSESIREPITINEENIENKTLIDNLNQPVMEINYYGPEEDIPYIEYELVIQSKYRSSEYFTFNDIKYSNEDNIKILNRVVQLHYSHMKRDDSASLKRHFSSIKEADSDLILNCNEIKRACKVNLTKL